MEALSRTQRLIGGVVLFVLSIVVIFLGASLASSTDTAWPGVLVLLGIAMLFLGVWLAYYVPKSERAARRQGQQQLIPTGTTGPGWFPDPESPSLRFWDGKGWTDQRAPLPPMQQGGNQSVFTIARGVALGLILFTVIGWFIYGMSSGNDAVECSQRNLNRVMEGSSYVEDCD